MGFVSEMITIPPTQGENTDNEENTKTSRSQEKKSSKVCKKRLLCISSRDLNKEKTSLELVSEMIMTQTTQEENTTKTSKIEERKSSKVRKKRLRCTSSPDFNDKKKLVEVVNEMITTPTTKEMNNNRDENTKTSSSQGKKSSKMRKKRLRCTSSRNYNEKKMSEAIVEGAIRTPIIEKRLNSEKLCFQSLSDSISTIERDMSYRVEGSRESKMRSKPLPVKNLFRISDFHAMEAEVVNEGETMSIDENVANDNTDGSDFINDSDSFSHVRRPLFHEFPTRSPDIRIGRLRVVNLARKHVPTRPKKRKRKKRKKWTLTTSSESE